MLLDPTITDATFVEGRLPKDIDETIKSIQEELGFARHPWRVISARTKLGRVLFEIEEATSSGRRRLIGKLGKSERALNLHRTLTALRNAGFKPPARFIVPAPVACLPERGMILQEKVPGRSASDFLTDTSERAALAATDCARWLAALHQSGVPAAAVSREHEGVSQWVDDLRQFVPNHTEQLDAIAKRIQDTLASDMNGLVPTHGDFHPMNVLIDGTQRVCGIDMDKFAAREPETDIGWFLMQSAGFGFFKSGTFNATEIARQTFIETYQAETGHKIRGDRAGLYMAMAFLKNLHFELVLLKTGRIEYAKPWLAGAAAFLKGDLYLSENP